MKRRRFLQALGASALCAPFIPDMARAEAGNAAKRMLIMFTPNGTIPHMLGPTGTGRDFTFAPGSIMEPLASRKDDLVVLGGLEFKNATNHEGGMAAMLTGSGNASSPGGGKSVDQHIASQLGGTKRFDSLELGVQTSAWGAGVQTRMSYSAPNTFVSPDDDPRSVFRRLFGDVTGDPGEVDRALVRRRSILDLTRGELTGMRDRVGAEQMYKIDAHLESIRTVERRLQGAPDPSMVGGSCDEPTPVMNLPLQDNDAYPAIGQAQLDLMLTALACDATQIATLQWSHTVGQTVFTWLGQSEGHHNLSHYDRGNQSGIDDYVAAERWYAERFLYLLDELDARPEPLGEGSMLDNTLVVWAQELGDGRNHVCTDVPWVLAGAKNILNTGQHIDTAGAPHTKLLVTLCQAMGLNDQIFGDPSHGTGALDGVLRT